MKKSSLIFLCLIAFILPAFLAKAQVKSKSFAYVLKRLLAHNVPEISVAKAAGSLHSYTFLDSRELEEFAVSHLPGAMYVGYKEFKSEVVASIPRDKAIIVYCSIGKRSENVAGKLINQGFRNVYNLYGGIFEWVNEGNAVYNNG